MLMVLTDVGHRFAARWSMFGLMSILSCDRVSDMSDSVGLPSHIPDVAKAVQASTDTRCGQEELV